MQLPTSRQFYFELPFRRGGKSPTIRSWEPRNFMIISFQLLAGSSTNVVAMEMKSVTRICVALFAMVFLNACEQRKDATLPTPEPVDGGIQRTVSYFHGPHDTYTRIFVEITGEETRVSEFGGNGPAVSLARAVGVKLFDQFLELKDIESF